MTIGALDPRARRMTADEWAQLPDDEPGERVDGCLVEDEMPDYVHEVIVAWLVRVLGAWVAPRGGLVGGSDAKFALGKHQGRKPDVSLYLPESKKLHSQNGGETGDEERFTAETRLDRLGDQRRITVAA